jgi:hypothetical protein
MMNLHWLLRAKRLAQSPPSMGRVYLVLAIIAVCIGLVIIERTIGWLNRCRRLAKDWECLNRNALAFLRWAAIRSMLRRLCQE